MTHEAAPSDIEKSGHDELHELGSLPPATLDAVETVDPAAERRLVRKIDFHIVPVIWLMFLFSNLDRSNIGNAYAGGMKTDLHMSSQQYSVALLVFFIGYCIAEIPSNMLLSRVRPSRYLPALMFVWGAIAIGLAGCKSASALAGVRAVLGCAESGFAPGVIFFVSSWYRKNELARRFCVYWTASPASGAFGGLLAGAVIKNLNGKGGLHGWQWLFIIEGLATCAAASIAYLVLPDFPTTTKWLTEDERRIAHARLQMDALDQPGSDAPSVGHMENLKAAFTDWRTYFFIFLYILSTGALTITYFIPTLVANLGYTGTSIQYMTVPIYGVCVVVILAVCFHSDYRQERGYHLAAVSAISAACFAGIVATTNHKAQYVLLCFAAACMFTAIPIVLVWVSNVILWPAEKRAIAQAATNAAGNAANIYGAFLWPSKDAPRYFAGFGTTLGFLALLAIGALTLKYMVRKFPYKM